MMAVLDSSFEALFSRQHGQPSWKRSNDDIPEAAGISGIYTIPSTAVGKV